jgi:hypothetical protein
LPSNTHKLLREIIDTENPVAILQEKFGCCSQKEDDELRGMLHELQENGFINVLWADDAPYYMTLNNSARTYEEQLAEYELQQIQGAKNAYNINAQQINIASGHSTINVAQYNGIDVSRLKELISDIKQLIPNTLSPDESETVNDSLDTIESISESNPPKKSLARVALSALQAIKGTVEFGAAIVLLVQFAQPFIH